MGGRTTIVAEMELLPVPSVISIQAVDMVGALAAEVGWRWEGVR